MNLEWSDEALADLDRFVEFPGRERPSLAKIVATETIDKMQVLSEHPQLGRPIAGQENIARSYCRFSARLMFFQYRFDGLRLVMLRVYHAREAKVTARPPESYPPAHEFGGKPADGRLQDDSHEALPKTPRVRKMAAMSCQFWSAHRSSGFKRSRRSGRKI
jgi:plasmid stabilization system protein ParE